MNMTSILELNIAQPMAEVEKRLKSNFIGLKWEIENTEDLRTIEGQRVTIYFGITSPYGGVSFMSFMSHGGGYVPFYIKITESNDNQTQVLVAITGSETVSGDIGNRNNNIAEQVLQMCEKDCTNKSFGEKVRSFFK